MLRLLALFLALVLTSNVVFAGLLGFGGSKDYTKRNEAYLRDVKKRDAKRKYEKAKEDRLPSGKMTVEEYERLAKHKNPQTPDELKPIEIPEVPIPSEMKYVPQPTYKIVRYNDPPGSVELSLKKNFYREKQQNAQGIVSPDFTKLVYAAIYYSPDSASTSAELFEIPLDTTETELDRILKAHTSNRTEKPLMETSKRIDNFGTFRTLTPVDFSTDGTKLLVKEKIGNSYDGIWQTNAWIYDFTTKEAKELSEIRDAITYHWTTYKGLPLQDKRWDIVPLGFSVDNPDRIVCTAYAYTGSKPVFLGIWSIDINREQTWLISFENVDIPISQSGFKIVKSGVVPYTMVEDEEKRLKELDKKHKKEQKKAEKAYYKQCEIDYKAELKAIDAEYRENIKEYNRLKKFKGSTTYNDAVEKYREEKIRELQKTIDKEQKQIEKLNAQIDKINTQLQEFEDNTTE